MGVADAISRNDGNMKPYTQLILDMDGVLWRGETPLSHLPDFFAALDALGVGYMMATNNATKTAAQYVAKFAGFGVDMPAWRILGSAEMTALFLRRQYEPGTRVFVIGESGLHNALSAQGFTIINAMNGENGNVRIRTPRLPALEPDVALVVVGFSRLAHYAEFAAGAAYIRRGARFIGTNSDASYPTEIGPLPGAGALLALLATGTGVEPFTIGKPGPTVYEEALRRLGDSAEKTLMVGDRLQTDILGAQNAGLDSALLLSGIADSADVAATGITPTYICDDIHDLLTQLQAAHHA